MKYALLFLVASVSLRAIYSRNSATSHHCEYPCKCPSSGCSELQLFQWVLFKEHAGMCMNATLLSLCNSSFYHSGMQSQLGASSGDSRTRNEDCASARDSIPMRSVDYLILIQQPCVAGSSTVENLLTSIETLVQQTQNSVVYHDVQVQFGFVIYTHRDKLEYLYARDFTSGFPPELRSHLLPSGCQLSGAAAVSSYRRVGSALEAVRRSLKLVNKQSKFHQRITLASNKSMHMWHRPYSDLHVLSIMDTDYSANNSTGGGKPEDLKIAANYVISKLSEKLVPAPVYPITFHVFFSAANEAATLLLGSPEAALRYSDCSHFRKAATLKALLAEKQGDTLQALLLSRGIELQLHFLRDLESTNCIQNISPALSTPLGIQPLYPDLCPFGDPGNEDAYCSTLHGWTRKGARSLNSDLFRDTVPLTDKYASSHADIAMSSSLRGIASTAVSGEELSISKTSGCSGLKLVKPVLQGQPRSVGWDRDAPFVERMLEGGEPVVLRGTVVDTWPALRKWSMAYLAQNMGTEILKLVKCTNNFLTFDPDHRAALKVDIPLSYTLANLSTVDFFECVQSSSICFDGYKGHYYFGAVPDTLKGDVSPDALLYNTQRDRDAGKQFMWVSSAGMITHTHFDQDYNIFVQLVGRKRFTLWSPQQHELLYTFPRVHPMWHKSRVNYRDVDVTQFPAFTRALGVQVELGPGDMLYVPPYTWHYVETLTPSVSLSTWSHDYTLYDHMNAIYRHDHKFDLLQNRRGQMFVLRLYLDMMVHDLFGFNETTEFFVRLVHNRFSGLEHLFPPSEEDPAICAAAVPGKIPTCVHVHGYAKLDMGVVGHHFQALEPTARDILFGDYVEEITAQVVGVKKMLAFFRYCFLGQQYYVTEVEAEEHLLWEHKDPEADGDDDMWT